jgi:hypothetical protein
METVIIIGSLVALVAFFFSPFELTIEEEKD